MAGIMNDQSHYQVDICVIGAGTAGISIATSARQFGLDVALIEQEKFGGHNLYGNEIPLSALKACANTAHTIRTADKFGMRAKEPQSDFHDIHAYIHQAIQRIEPRVSKDRLEGLGIKIIKAQARFINKREINATDTDQKNYKIKARHFIIATGSTTNIPPIAGLDSSSILTPKLLFQRQELCPELIIIGNSNQALELAQCYQRLGSKITLINEKKLLPYIDKEISQEIKAILINEGVKILEDTDIQSIRHVSQNEIIMNVDNDGYERVIKGSHLLIANERTANIHHLNLDKASIDTHQNKIATNKTLLTNQKHIWAAGSCRLDSKNSIKDAHALIQNLCFKKNAEPDSSLNALIINTSPEIAHIELSEQQAKEIYGDKNIIITKSYIKHNDKAITNNDENGLIKLITNTSEKILGVTIFSQNANELITPWIIAIEKKMRIRDLSGLPLPPTTYSEIHKRVAGKYFSMNSVSTLPKKIVRLLTK